MSDIKLFRLHSGHAIELQGDASDLEKPLQTLIEANLDTLLGIRFLATEYSTGKTHAGRIDSLGLDENNCPVILEYKRSVGENVINQGLFYLDWLMDHQAEFKLLVMDKLGKPAADAIDWTAPRLVCIAADFTRYDGHAVQQINRNIELIRYRRFGEELLLLELANASSASSGRPSATKPVKLPKLSPLEPVTAKAGTGDRSFADWVPMLPPHLSELMASLEGHVLSLGDDVQRKELKLYVAFKRLKNFATVVPQKARLLLYLHVDPDQLLLVPPNGRDVRQQGHWGTGDLELALACQADLDAAKPLILMAYEGRALPAMASPAVASSATAPGPSTTSQRA
jgi:predicted transport protein